MPQAVAPKGLVQEKPLSKLFYDLVLKPPLLTLAQRLLRMHLLSFHL